MKVQNIGFIGLGKLGGPCATEIAKKGHRVYGYDTSNVEPDQVQMVDTYADLFTQASDIVFIAVPTPHDEKYDGREPTSHLEPKDFDYSIVKEVMERVNVYAQPETLVVLISTVLPGTVRREIIPLLDNKNGIRFVYNPYLIAMGTVGWDMVNPEMVMIGTGDGSATGDAKQLVDFYETIMENDPRYEIGTWDECEAIKIFYNCYSDDTETLTNDGWKLIKDVGDNTVLTLDPKTMTPEFIKPTQIVSKQHTGNMIHFHSSKDDLLVTEDHNMFVGSQVSKMDDDVHCGYYKWNLITAREVIKRNGFAFCRSTKWHVDQKESFVDLGFLKLPTQYYVEFMAWYLSEGCIDSSNGRIIISQNKDINSQKYDMIDDVFSHIHQLSPHSYKLCRGKTGISLIYPELSSYLLQFGKSFDKFVPENIKSMNVSMIRLFLDTYNLGDGSSMKETKFNGQQIDNKKYKYYATLSDQMSSDLGELIIKVGHFPSYRTTRTKLSNKDCHLVYELLGKTSVFRRSSNAGLKYDTVHYDGEVYCAMFDKNHVFLTRRNGKCSWQGNTFISTKITLVNMIQDVAEKQGNINVDVVTNALANSTHRIMSPMYMKAGMSDGGACHPRDNIALRHMAKELDLGYDLFDAIMGAREIQAKNMADFLLSYKLPVIILGKSYKPGVPYEEGSGSILVGSFIDGVRYDTISDEPAVYLLAHPKDEFDEGAVGSVVVDPWRQVKSKHTVYNYGNTR